MTVFGRTRTILAAVCAMAAAPRTPAQVQAPAPESGTPIVRSGLEDGALRITDTAGAPVIVPGAAPLVEGCDPGVKWDVQLQPQPSGADLIFTFTGTAPGRRQIGTINIGTLALGPTVTIHDLRGAGDAVSADCNTFVARSWTYPGELYSPAWVVSNSAMSVGISLQYPVLQWRHDVRLTMSSPLARGPGIENARGWQARFQLGGAGQRLTHGSEVGQGQTRVYVVSIRVCQNPREWVRTLTPYRDFFRATYGAVRYERQPEPMLALTMSDPALISDDNPQGWNASYRPDLGGWGRLTRRLRVELGGWDAYMLASPGGQYAVNRQHNPPYQFATAWNSSPELASALEPYNGLPAVGKTGKRLALHWARSYQVTPGWDVPRVEGMDLDKPEHVQAALNEIEMAVRAGAGTVVLGSSKHTLVPAWDQHQWIEQLAMHFTSTSFVVEPGGPDFIHAIAGMSLAATMENGRPTREQDLYTLRHPFWMADFLLPGHETWGVLKYTMLKRAFHQDADGARVLQDTRRLALLGYVPVAHYDNDLTTNIAAAESWKQTVPADLQLEAPAFASAAPVVKKPPAKQARGAPQPQDPLVARALANAAKPGAAKNARNAKKSMDITVKPGGDEAALTDPDFNIPDRNAILHALRRARAFSPNANPKLRGKYVAVDPTKVLPPEEAEPK